MRFFVLVSLAFIGIAASTHFWFGKTLNPRVVEEKWGNQNFDVLKFKSGTVENRAAMASSLLKSKKTWIGKSYLEIEKQLGPHDGYYFNDIYPALHNTDRRNTKRRDLADCFSVR